MVNVLCLSPQFAKNQKSNDLPKSVFHQQQQMIGNTRLKWVQTMKLFRGPQPGSPTGWPSGAGERGSTPEDGRAGLGHGCATRVRCHFSSLSFNFPGTNPAHN